MAFEPKPHERGAPPPARYRYRLRFAKAGDLRFVSHHDLMHVIERMMRRGRIPFAMSQGFHPQPKMTFALSLALGVVGHAEIFELELTEPLEPADLEARLNAAAPAGLVFRDASRRTVRGVQVRRAFYRLELTESLPDLPDRIDRFLAEPTHVIVRQRPQRRRLDVRPYVFSLKVVPPEAAPNPFGDFPAGGWLELVLWIAPTGAARPEEIAHALGLAPLLEAGAVLERSHLELMDEVPESERSLPDRLSNLAAVAEPTASPDTPDDEPAADEPRARSSSPTALISNPLSFDS